MDRKKTILVTGGAGYIGSITTKRLSDFGYKVIVIDNLKNGHLSALPKNIIFEEIDLCDKKSLNSFFLKYKPDAVIDFAAYLAVGESMVEPKMYMNNNIQNFIYLLDAMVASGCKYLVKSSTAAVYGNPKSENDLPLREEYTDNKIFEKSELLDGQWDKKELTGEVFFNRLIDYYHSVISSHKDKEELKLSKKEVDQLRIPSNVYGFTKLLDEILMKKYDDLFQLKGIALRYFNVAGALETGEMGEDHPIETHLIPLVIKNVAQNLPFKITGADYNTPDGTAIRDYVHVADLADGHIKACEFIFAHNKSGTFNLGNGIGYTVLEIIKNVEEIACKKVTYTVAPRRLGDPERLLASPQKANNVLGWKTSYSLKNMIESAWKWHNEHPNGYNDYK